MTIFIQSDRCNICHCAQNEDIWEKGITTVCMINPVLLHTIPLDNILATNLSMLTFFSLHICYQMEQVTLSLITYTRIPISMGYDILHNLPI